MVELVVLVVDHNMVVVDHTLVAVVVDIVVVHNMVVVVVDIVVVPYYFDYLVVLYYLYQENHS